MECRVSPSCDLGESGPGLPLRIMFRLVLDTLMASGGQILWICGPTVNLILYSTFISNVAASL